MTALEYVAQRLVQIRLEGAEFDLRPMVDHDHEGDPSEPTTIEKVIYADIGVWLLVRFLTGGQTVAWGARFFPRPQGPNGSKGATP